ncbi:hypothetical protein ZEAMMB73_Zm00001d048904 [Zea mays]|nr:hypothetical protein ZEAMMB73_Zm00001d048904 [Zea mays]
MGTSQAPRQHLSQNRASLTSKVTAKIRKILLKAKAPRKKKTTMYPVLAAALKFHKDDDVCPAAAGVKQQQQHNKEM